VLNQSRIVLSVFDLQEP